MNNTQLYNKLNEHNKKLVYCAVNKQLSERKSPVFSSRQLFETDRYLDKWLEDNNVFGLVLSVLYTKCCQEIERYKNKALVTYAINYIEHTFQNAFLQETQLTIEQRR